MDDLSAYNIVHIQSIRVCKRKKSVSDKKAAVFTSTTQCLKILLQIYDQLSPT